VKGPGDRAFCIFYTRIRPSAIPSETFGCNARIRGLHFSGSMPGWLVLLSTSLPRQSGKITGPAHA
jgi:hypothetical protein